MMEVVPDVEIVGDSADRLMTMAKAGPLRLVVDGAGVASSLLGSFSGSGSGPVGGCLRSSVSSGGDGRLGWSPGGQSGAEDAVIATVDGVTARVCTDGSGPVS